MTAKISNLKQNAWGTILMNVIICINILHLKTRELMMVLNLQNNI